ncbi:THO complex subunit 2-like [Saccoglossus kowalevskii]
MKHEDTNLSPWLQSLANFCGAVFRKYNIELSGLLQYVANQLKAGKSFDLLILKEVVQKMSGIESTEEITVDQLDALAGGELLRAEGGYFSQVRNTKKSSQRLKDALLENDLAIPICLLMAQQRNCIVFKEGQEKHLKLVGKLFDQCQDTLVQFGGFLATQLGTEDYTKKLPPLGEMVEKYHITADAAFYMYRPMFAHAITAKVDELRKAEKGSKQSSSSGQKSQRYVQAVEIVMTPVIESVRSLHVTKVWDDISPQFYVTFWSLTMYDLYVPSGSYEKEINKIKSQLSTLEDNRDVAPSKKRKEKEKYNLLIDKLKDEEKKQQEHCQRVVARLKNEKDNWFQSRSTKNETITQFLQLCIFPRCCFTASDSVYCAKFVHTVHGLKTPNFSTLLCYDRMFSDISYIVASCTENEASRYGRFLCAMLETLMRWHSDRHIYEKECGNYPGFVTILRASNTDASSKADQLDYENFRHVCHKWQYKITKAVVICLESHEYVQIRNTLIVLTKILQYYPMVQNLGQALERRVDKIRQEEKDKRKDIFALAMGYSGQLKSRKGSMIPEHQFHQKEKENQPKSTTQSSSQQNGPVTKPDAVSQSSGTAAAVSSHSTGSSLNPEARSFTSKTDKTKDGAVKSSSSVSTSSKSQPSKGNSAGSGKTSYSSSERKSTGSTKLNTSIKEDRTDSDKSQGKDEKEKDRKEKEPKPSKDDNLRYKEEKNSKDDRDDDRKEQEDGSKNHSRHREKDRDARDGSATSTSSHSSSKSSRKPEYSPRKEESERDTKRRKVDGQMSSPLSAGKDRQEIVISRDNSKSNHSDHSHDSRSRERERGRSNDRERDRDREKERKSEKKREYHADGEKETHEVKRRKDDDRASSKSRHSTDGKEKESEKNREREREKEHHRDKERDRGKDRERGKSKDRDREKDKDKTKVKIIKTSKSSGSKKESKDKDGRDEKEYKNKTKDRDSSRDREGKTREDKHSSSSRKKSR